MTHFLHRRNYRLDVHAFMLHGLGVSLFFVVLAAFFLPFFAGLLPLLFAHEDGDLAVGRLLSIAVFTTAQAGASAFFSVMIGMLAAFFVARRHFWGRSFLLSLAGIPFAVPTIIVALAFIVFFGRNGILNATLMKLFNTQKAPIDFLYSVYGLIIAHSFYNFPIAMRSISLSWESLNEDRESAALLLGASDWRIFKTIIFPALLPSIISSFLIIFLYSFFSFLIVLLFGGIGTTVLEVELYRTVRSTFNPRRAAFIILIESLISSGIAMLYVHIHTVARKKNPPLHSLRPTLPLASSRHPLLEKSAFALLMFLISFFLLAPLASIIARSFTQVNFTQTRTVTIAPWLSLFSTRLFWKSFATTLFVGIASASLSVLSASVFAYFVFIKHFRVSVLSVAPIVVSTLALGFGWTRLLSYASPIVLIVAQSAIAWPIAWMQLHNALTRIPSSVLDAATLLSSPTESFFLTLMPLCKKALGTAFAFSFAISVGDASLPLILSIPNFHSLALLVFRLAGSYRFAQSAVAASVLSLLTASTFLLKRKRP